MHTWLLITIIATAAAAGLFLLLILRRLLSPPPATPNPNSRDLNIEKPESLESGIAELHHVNTHHQIDIGINKKHLLRRDISPQMPLFTWSDYPALVTDAVEHGWSRFAFTTPYTSSQSIRSSKTQSLFGACAGATEERETGVEITWEVTPGSADFMQKIRLNSCLKKIYPVSVIKTALPLPGPPLGNNSSFPQEAYFEITVLKTGGDGEGQFGNLRKMRSESEKANLIQPISSGKVGSESIIHVISSVHENNKKFEGLKSGGISVSIGLVRGGPIPLKLPGSFLGSVGFNSDGSVYLDGKYLHYSFSVCGINTNINMVNIFF